MTTKTKNKKPFNSRVWERLRNDYVIKSNQTDKAKEKMLEYDRTHSEVVKPKVKRRGGS